MEIWNYPGTTPYEEDCAQLGAEDYRERARADALALAAQIERMIGPGRPGATVPSLAARPRGLARRVR